MAAVCEALAAKWMFSLVAGGVCWLTSAHRLTWVTGLRPHQPSLANGRSRAALVGGKTPEHSPHSFCFTIISHQFMALLSRAGGFQRRFVHDQGLWKQRDYRFMGLFQHHILTRFVYSQQQQQLLQQQHNWVIRAGLMFTFTAAEGLFLVIRGCPCEAPVVSRAQLQLKLRKVPPSVGERHTCEFQGPWKAKTADSWLREFFPVKQNKNKGWEL